MNISKNDGFENINVYCFDMDQYNHLSKYLICTVIANYEGITYFQDVKIWLGYYFKWSKNKWLLYKDSHEIKNEGLTYIINHIRGENDN